MFFYSRQIKKTILKSSKEMPPSAKVMKFTKESVILNGKFDINKLMCWRSSRTPDLSMLWRMSIP